MFLSPAASFQVFLVFCTVLLLAVLSMQCLQKLTGMPRFWNGMSLLGTNSEATEDVSFYSAFVLAVSSLAMSFPEAGKEYHCSTKILSKAQLMAPTQECDSSLMGEGACTDLDF